MVFIVIRVSGPEFPVDEFLRSRDLEVDAIWRKGEISRKGRPLDESGFNLSLPDFDSWVQALPLVHSFLLNQKELFRELVSLNLSMVMDIGVTVGEEKSFAPSLEFPVKFLSDLASYGVILNVSAYPTSDET